MDKRDTIISVITTPLGFFALSLLIIEGFLSIVVIGSGNSLKPEGKLFGIGIAAAAFFTIVIIVALMVWLIPENLTLSGDDWKGKGRNRDSYGDSNNTLSKGESEKLEATTFL